MPGRLQLGVLLGSGFATAASAQVPARFDGQYVGELTLTRVTSGDCSQPAMGALYPLTISRGEVRFAYVPRFNTTLVGTVSDAGIIKAVARRRTGSIQMRGRVQGSNITAYIASPSCNYTFQTKN